MNAWSGAANDSTVYNAIIAFGTFYGLLPHT